MGRIALTALLVLTIASLAGCTSSVPTTAELSSPLGAGFRWSTYGPDSEPAPEYWAMVGLDMARRFPGAGSPGERASDELAIVVDRNRGAAATAAFAFDPAAPSLRNLPGSPTVTLWRVTARTGPMWGLWPILRAQSSDMSSQSEQ